MILDKVLHFSEQIQHKQLDNGWHVYINPDQSTWMRIDQHGYELFEKVDGKNSINGIIQHISNKYAISKSHIEEDITSFFKESIERKILQTDNNKEVPVKTEYELEKLHIYIDDALNIDPDNYLYQTIKEADKKLPENVSFHFRIINDNINLVPLLNCVKSNRKIVLITKLIVEKELVNIKSKETEVSIWLYNGEIDFSSLEQKITLLKKAGLNNISINLTINSTSDNMDELYKFAIEKSVFSINVENDMIAKEGYKLDIKTRKQFIKACEAIFKSYTNNRVMLPFALRREMTHTHINCYGINFRTLFLNGINYSNCGLGTRLWSMNANGDIYPCQYLHKSSLKIGNIISNSIEELVSISKEKYSNLSSNDKECTTCQLTSFCNKGCRSAVLEQKNDIEAIDSSCAIIKDIFWKVIQEWMVTEV